MTKKRTLTRAQKDHFNAYMREYQAKKRAWLWEYKHNLGCADCGEKNPVVLDFDHDNPEEKHPKLRARRYGMAGLSWKDLTAEVLKCTVRCANCHRIRTAKQQGWVVFE